MESLKHTNQCRDRDRSIPKTGKRNLLWRRSSEISQGSLNLDMGHSDQANFGTLLVPFISDNVGHVNITSRITSEDSLGSYSVIICQWDSRLAAPRLEADRLLSLRDNMPASDKQGVWLFLYVYVGVWGAGRRDKFLMRRYNRGQQ